MISETKSEPHLRSKQRGIQGQGPRTESTGEKAVVNQTRWRERRRNSDRFGDGEDTGREVAERDTCSATRGFLQRSTVERLVVCGSGPAPKGRNGRLCTFSQESIPHSSTGFPGHLNQEYIFAQTQVLEVYTVVYCFGSLPCSRSIYLALHCRASLPWSYGKQCYVIRSQAGPPTKDQEED